MALNRFVIEEELSMLYTYALFVHMWVPFVAAIILSICTEWTVTLPYVYFCMCLFYSFDSF